MPISHYCYNSKSPGASIIASAAALNDLPRRFQGCFQRCREAAFRVIAAAPESAGLPVAQHQCPAASRTNALGDLRLPVRRLRPDIGYVLDSFRNALDVSGLDGGSERHHFVFCDKLLSALVLDCFSELGEIDDILAAILDFQLTPI